MINARFRMTRTAGSYCLWNDHGEAGAFAEPFAERRYLSAMHLFHDPADTVQADAAVSPIAAEGLGGGEQLTGALHEVEKGHVALCRSLADVYVNSFTVADEDIYAFADVLHAREVETPRRPAARKLEQLRDALRAGNVLASSFHRLARL